MITTIAIVIGIVVGVVVGITIFSAIFSTIIVALKIRNTNSELKSINTALDVYIKELKI